MGIQNITLLTAIVLTGLSAGLFYAWSVSVIPGTQKLESLTYLQTMQSINREILNPAFFLVFFGSLIALVAATYLHYSSGSSAFTLLVLASVTYLLGTLAVTGLGNVPLNNELDLLQLGELSSQAIEEFRMRYETGWNRLHTIRMLFSVLSFILSLLALSSQLNTQ